MIEAPGLQIFDDVGIDQPDFATPCVRIGFGNRRLAVAQRFDLAAGQCNAGLEFLADLVVEARLAVLGHDLETRLWFGRHWTYDLPKQTAENLFSGSVIPVSGTWRSFLSILTVSGPLLESSGNSSLRTSPSARESMLVS